MSTTADGPAFPSETDTHYYLGLTKRELFAAMAMQGVLSNGSCVDENAYTNIITKDAVRIADALIEQLNKEVQS